MPPPAPCARTKQVAVYRRRRPECTALYQAVQAHLETWLAQKWEDEGDGYAVPPWAEREFRAFLRCGILALGFARGRWLALFKRRGLLTPEAVADMRQWEHGGGFSLDATIRIEGHLSRKLCLKVDFGVEDIGQFSCSKRRSNMALS